MGTSLGHERREVPIPRFLAHDLADHVAGRGVDQLVFPPPKGRALRAQGSQGLALTEAAASVGLNGPVRNLDRRRSRDGSSINVQRGHRQRSPRQTGEALSANTIARTIGSSVGTAVIAAVISSNATETGMPSNGAVTLGFWVCAATGVVATVAAILAPPRRSPSR